MAQASAAQVLSGHTKKVHSVAWNCTGSRLASGAVDWTARLWAVDEGRGKSIGELKGHASSVDQLCWNPTHRDQIATASRDKTIKVWDARCTLSSGGGGGQRGRRLGVVVPSVVREPLSCEAGLWVGEAIAATAQCRARSFHTGVRDRGTASSSRRIAPFVELPTHLSHSHLTLPHITPRPPPHTFVDIPPVSPHHPQYTPIAHHVCAALKCTSTVSTIGENINIAWSPNGNYIAVGDKVSVSRGWQGCVFAGSGDMLVIG